MVLHRKHPEQYIAEWRRSHDERLAHLTEADQSGKFASVQADLEPQGPILRDGFFEANVRACHMYPIYWKDQPRALLRGTWFVEAGGLKRALLPLPCAAALVLEHAWQSGCVPHLRAATAASPRKCRTAWHIYLSGACGMTDAPGNTPTMQGHHQHVDLP